MPDPSWQQHQQQSREDLRMAVLDYLAGRCALVFDAPSIHRALLSRRRDLESPTLDQISEALTFLRGLGYVAAAPHKMGATLYWKATSDGILASERGSLPS